jgi:DNA-binding beta-propeller fold protein YncE
MMGRTRTLLVIGILVVVGVVAGVASHLAAAGDPLVRTVAMDALPVAVAVDATSGQAYVIDRGASNRTLTTTGYPAGGGVSVIDLASGNVVRTVALDTAPRAVAVDEAAGHALLAGDGGSVTVLDTHRGAVVGTLPVGVQPRAIAVDQATGRALVVNAGDDSVSVLDTANNRR